MVVTVILDWVMGSFRCCLFGFSILFNAKRLYQTGYKTKYYIRLFCGKFCETFHYSLHAKCPRGQLSKFVIMFNRLLLYQSMNYYASLFRRPGL